MLFKEYGGFKTFCVLEYKHMDENRIETNSHRSRSSYSGEDYLLPTENSHIQTDESAVVSTCLNVPVQS